MAEDDGAVVICPRVADLPNPVEGAVPGWCGRCREKVWRSPATQRMTGRLEYLCIPCMVADTSLDPSTFGITDETYAELVKELGLHSREEFAKQVVEQTYRARGEQP
jgi:hypothetical protein